MQYRLCESANYHRVALSVCIDRTRLLFCCTRTEMLAVGYALPSRPSTWRSIEVHTSVKHAEPECWSEVGEEEGELAPVFKVKRWSEAFGGATRSLQRSFLNRSFHISKQIFSLFSGSTTFVWNLAFDGPDCKGEGRQSWILLFG